MSQMTTTLRVIRKRDHRKTPPYWSILSEGLGDIGEEDLSSWVVGRKSEEGSHNSRSE